MVTLNFPWLGYGLRVILRWRTTSILFKIYLLPLASFFSSVLDDLCVLGAWHSDWTDSPKVLDNYLLNEYMKKSIKQQDRVEGRQTRIPVLPLQLIRLCDFGLFLSSPTLSFFKCLKTEDSLRKMARMTLCGSSRKIVWKCSAFLSHWASLLGRDFEHVQRGD